MDPVQLAIKSEQDAIEFYRQAAERTSHPVGKKMFLSIVEDEKRHLEIFSAMFRGMDMKVEGISPIERIKTVFEENRGFMLQKIKATTDELDALKIAMQMERESVNSYEKASQEARNSREKAIFERLAKEENEHFTIFTNTYEFLVDSGNWFMWEEHSMVDGGTPWA
ncbi:MAG: ferritin family protein [Nitrospiraceae bacterium]|nr:ferritin family protein [Nitrospiraceae bacterium]